MSHHSDESGGASLILTASGVCAGDDLLTPGWVEIAADRIVAVGAGHRPGAEDLGDALLVPGFVDTHVHGGGGAAFSTTSDAEIDRVLATHRAHGTTTMNASLVTSSSDDLRAQVAALAPRVAAGDLAGIHLEGPWLDPGHKGAHDAGLLREPDLDLLTELLELSGDTIRMVTLAPELPHGLEMVRLLHDRGVVAAVGHTRCTYDETRAAIDAGATGATHLFNAMPPVHHREPGPVLALVRDSRVYVELIVDGVHVHPDLAASVLHAVGPRGVLVTDAMAAAGQPDGEYLLGSLPVTVTDGVARLTGTDTIAGSTLTLDRAVARAHRAGLSVVDAVAAATRHPAAYQRLEQVGELAPGFRADVVALAPDLSVRRVLRAGAWI